MVRFLPDDRAPGTAEGGTSAGSLIPDQPSPAVDWRGMLAVQTAARLAAEEALAAAMARIRQQEDDLRIAEQLARVGSWTWEFGAETVQWSEQAHRILGSSATGAAFGFATYLAMLHPSDAKAVLAAVRESLEHRQEFEVEHRIVRADGSIREIFGRGRAHFDSAGHRLRITGSLQDVTESNAASRELRHSRDLFAGILDAATDQAIVATDAQGTVTVFNTGAQRMLGYSAQEIIGSNVVRLHDPTEIGSRFPDLGSDAAEVVLARLAAGKADGRSWTYVTRDGGHVQAMVTVTAMRGPDGQVTGYITVGTDVTAALRAQAALAASEARFRDTFENAPNGMMLLAVTQDEPGRFLDVNAALCELTGYSREQLLDMQVGDLTHPEHVEVHRQRFRALLEGRPGKKGAESHWVHADGSDLWVVFSVNARRGGRDQFVVGQVEDITARKQAEARLTHQALHDWLTGLPNRSLLLERINHALAARARSGLQIGVLYLDLDGFKSVNDAAGHASGDRILIDVADRLRRAVRPGDTVARMGGDEFVVVCSELASDSEVMPIAERLLAALQPPHVVMGQAFSVGASFGIAVSEPTSTAESLLRQADGAMYRAKRAGRGRIGAA